MSERAFVCPRCTSHQFVRVEIIMIDDAGKALRTDDDGFKCANCLQRFRVEPAGIVFAEDSGKHQPASTQPRVRSSVSAAERGVVEPQPRDRDTLR